MSRKYISPVNGFGDVTKEASTSDDTLPSFDINDIYAEFRAISGGDQMADFTAEQELWGLLESLPVGSEVGVDDEKAEPIKRKKEYNNDEDEVDEERNEKLDPKRAKHNESSRNYIDRKIAKAARASNELNEKFPYVAVKCAAVLTASKKSIIVNDSTGKDKKEGRAYSSAKERNYNKNKAVIHEVLLEFFNRGDHKQFSETKKERAANLTICLGVMMAEQDNIEYAASEKKGGGRKVYGFYQDPQNRLDLLKAPPCLPSDAEFISKISEMLISARKDPSFFNAYKLPDIFKQQVLRPMLSALAKNEQDDLSSVSTNFRALFVKKAATEAKAAPSTSINPRDEVDQLAKASSSSQSKFS